MKFKQVSHIILHKVYEKVYNIKKKTILIVISSGLKANFQDVKVEIVDCPNLSAEPFHLASEGLSGSPLLIEIGGPPYLLPLVNRSKVYDLKSICQRIAPKSSDILAIGAGAGPYPVVNSNCEVSDPHIYIFFFV